MSRFMLCFVCALCLVAGKAFADDSPGRKGPGAAGASKADKGAKSSRITSSVEAACAAKLTDEESREVSFAAGRILKHVAQARDMIEDKKQDEAARQIDLGLKLVAIVEGVLPRVKVKTRIASGDVVYTDEDEVMPRFVTLFEELDRRDIISPVLQAKQEVARKQAASKPELGAAAGHAPAPVIVSRADLEYSAVRLDIGLTRRLLHAARQELAENQPGQADARLHALQAGAVLMEFDEMELPLEQAADNLKLAEAELAEGDREDARVALQAAIDELQNYEKQAGESRAADVKLLREEIAKVTAELKRADLTEAELQKLAAKVSQWWEQSRKWFKKKG